MNTLVQQLHEKRERIACSVKTHEAFVSCTVRRFPSEVLSEIFMRCLPNTKYPAADTRAAPLLLTRICRVWRGVALGTPSLWCSLAIKEPMRKPEQQLSIYQRWLGNSGGFPLSLKVDLLDRFYSRDWRDHRQWMKTAVVFSGPYTKRCTDLAITFHSADGLDLLLGNVPDLECLYLEGYLNTTTERNLSIVQPHPRLHKLIIRSPCFDKNTMSFFNPGWTNLTHLGMLFHQDIVDPHIVLTLLQMCPNLEHLLFSEILAGKVDGPVSLTHAILRTLEWEMYGEGMLFNTLVLPDLRRLRLNGDSNDSCQPLLEGSGGRAFDMTFKGLVHERDIDDLFNVFYPGWTELTSITLDIAYGNNFGFLPLQFCPNLENMVALFGYVKELSHAPLTHHKLRSLTISLEEGYIGHLLDKLTLPNLRELDLRMKTNWTHKEFKNFISRSNCQLETLKIKGVAVSGEEREEFASLIPTLKLLELHDTREKLAA